MIVDDKIAAKSWRVKPRVWIGVAIWAGYVLLVYAIQVAVGVPYDQLGQSGSNLFWGAGFSLIVATVLLAATTSILGWWKPALFDRARSRHRWPIIAPFLMAAALLINLISTDWGSFDLAFLAAAIALILVGFTEEMATRGLLLVGLRARFGEGWVWFLSSAMFAVMHLTNILLGAPVAGTVQQLGLAFVGGTVFYILRRTTGTLIWAMLLHGLWDFSTFAVTHGTPSTLAPVGNLTNIIAGLLALVVVAFVIRGSDERITRGK
ncbi:MAG TPA: CPBP family intramembrane metalloprotease [Rhodoglobus sp.]|nr:CPBP family intramembrane metalloprotease [Rhodoglobus sp.]